MKIVLVIIAAIANLSVLAATPEQWVISCPKQILLNNDKDGLVMVDLLTTSSSSIMEIPYWEYLINSTQGNLSTWDYSLDFTALNATLSETQGKKGERGYQETYLVDLRIKSKLFIDTQRVFETGSSSDIWVKETTRLVKCTQSLQGNAF